MLKPYRQENHCFRRNIGASLIPSTISALRISHGTVQTEVFNRIETKRSADKKYLFQLVISLILRMVPLPWDIWEGSKGISPLKEAPFQRKKMLTSQILLD